MYHQFKELADIDITKEPMEVGPTTHYVMGGVRVDPDSQMTSLPGLFACGEVAAGLHGANRLGGNSLSDLLVFGKRAGQYAANFSKENKLVKINPSQLEETITTALKAFDNAASSNGSGQGPYQLQQKLEQTMQDFVGIVRIKEEMQQALQVIGTLREQLEQIVIFGNREYNMAWHTTLDLHHLLTVSEAIARAALERNESRGAHFREDYPLKDESLGKLNTILRKGPDGEMLIIKKHIPAMPEDLKKIIEENQ